MDNNSSNNEKQNESFEGYSTPGQDEIIQSTSEAIPSPSQTSRQRQTMPDAFIGGEVNSKPGSANPALAETIGEEKGQVSTADLLRARESAEEEHIRQRGAEIYEDQVLDSARRGGGPVGRNNDEAIYQEREFGRPTEPSELEMLGGRGVNLPDEEDDGR